MRVLSSKVFEITEEADIAAFGGELFKWLPCSGGLIGKRITVSIETAGKDRTKKKTALRQLEELIVDNIAEDEDTPVVWAKLGYCFKFMSRKYFWNNTEIHITANEALFLYRWLVLHDDIRNTQRYYLRNMRKRLGKDFLAEEQTDEREP
jgi:hypothetical protein